MARFSTLYYFFAVLAVLAVLTQAAPVQQQDEGLPMGLDGLMGGKNNANPASPSAQQEEDPNKMFDQEVEEAIAHANAQKSQQAEKARPTPVSHAKAPNMMATPEASPSGSAKPMAEGDGGDSASQPAKPPASPLDGLPVVGSLLSGLSGGL